jgi:signal transduction histidine kinase
MELVKQPFSLQGWLDKIAQENAVLAQEKGIKFKSEIDPGMPDTLTGDAARLRQVVVNLISNAIKFTNEGEVKLQIHPDGKETWAIVVSDTGIGIAPHKQETIFNEFYQVDSSATREHGGTGLGLAIVRRLVLTMGGSVRVNSTLGQGSTFTVTLPLENIANSIA